MDRRAGLLFVALGFAWGIPYLLIKVSIEELSPEVLVLARTALAAALLLPIAAARGALGRGLLRRWRVLLAYAVVEVSVPWVALGHAEGQLPSATTGLLIAAVPLAGVALAFATGSAERLGRQGWVGLLSGLAGVAALVGFDIDTAHLGAVLQVGVVVIGYAVGPFLVARYLGAESGVGVIAVSLSMAAIISLPVVLLGPGLPSAAPSVGVVAAVGVLAIVCTAGAFVMLFALIGMIGPVRATAITYLNPAVAIIVGAVFLDEAVTPWTLLGFGLVILGSVLLTRRPAARDGAAPVVEGGRSGGLDEGARGRGEGLATIGRTPAAVARDAVAWRLDEPRPRHARAGVWVLDHLGEARGVAGPAPAPPSREPLTGRRWG